MCVLSAIGITIYIFDILLNDNVCYLTMISVTESNTFGGNTTPGLLKKYSHFTVCRKALATCSSHAESCTQAHLANS